MAFVTADKRALVLRLKNPDVVLQHLPHKLISRGDKDFVAVPHTPDVYRVLRNLGIKLDGMTPFEQRYTPPKIKGEYPPGPHQIATAAFMTTEPRGYVLSTPRTGKTASALMAIDFLLQEKEIEFAIVVAPLTCLRDVWEEEALGMSLKRSLGVLVGTNSKVLKMLSQPHDVFIINPDRLKTIALELRVLLAGRTYAVVIDESTDYANKSTDRWKSIAPIVKEAKYCHLMTGTPGGPDSVFGQACLNTPHTVPKSYTSWRDKTMIQTDRFTWKPRPNFEEHVKTALSPSIRFDKKDVMPWLPKVQTLSRSAELTKMQREMYESMRKDMVVTMNDTPITAANAAVMSAKLVQIACGAVVTDTGEAVMLDVAPRLSELLRIISETDSKVVVFAPFKAVLRQLAEMVGKHHSCALVDGSVTGSKRDAVFKAFRTQKDPHVLLAHPRTTSFGLELAVADTIVFWGPPLNGPFVYQQAVERIQSAQQKSATPAIVHLHSSAAERHIFKSIAAGVNLNEHVVNLFRTIVTVPA